MPGGHPKNRSAAPGAEGLTPPSTFEVPPVFHPSGFTPS
jgi:hypothetical protein